MPSNSSGGPSEEARLQARLQAWADGKATLRDVRGYSDEELYAIARTAYFYYYQGRLNEARTLFQGLYAVNPTDPYFAKALGVVEMAAENPQGAVQAYDVALKLAPEDAGAYVGRAEVRLALGQRGLAADDLRRATQYLEADEPLFVKASAMLDALTKR